MCGSSRCELESVNFELPTIVSSCDRAGFEAGEGWNGKGRDRCYSVMGIVVRLQ